jgi:hypothetical protein
MRFVRRGSHALVIGGPVPPGADAITLWRFIFVRPEAAHSEYLLRHELVHVRQWRRYGVLGFSVRYLAPYVKWRLAGKGHHGAYLRIPFEIEADWVARRTLAAERAVARADNLRAPLA